ncbi:hypothetical protein FOF44_00180 [Vibrio algivorus]|uniref:Uncharacterized protein n=1 Tax=Vibrio algivorus TaxID=1667024 RepID=A0A557PGZ5_9VIBR|nr:hypothetical protein [Vibrio algivorus]TVO39921.1 hypothetical protein FOF44_00180 [Vibrio algivorus]
MIVIQFELHYNALKKANELAAPGKKIEIGFKARRLRRDGKIENLPHEYGFILKACEEFIDNPKRFPSLYAWGGEAIRNILCRTLIAKVLATLLPNCDLFGGRIGEPTEAGIKTISYDQLQEDYALRFGEYISPKSFAKAIRYLKRAGFLSSERINVNVDLVEGQIRSAPAYKMLTERFFNELKVVRYPKIVDLIMATRKRQQAKGLNFSWLSFREIASRVQQIYNATSLNTISDHMATLFTAHQSKPNLSPH